MAVKRFQSWECNFHDRDFSRPYGYNSKSLKSLRSQRKGKLNDTVGTMGREVPRAPRIEIDSCGRVLPRDIHVSCSPLVFTLAKFISSKNEHFRYMIQADDGSNRIFVLSVYTGPTAAHIAVSSRDKIAVRILEGTSLFTPESLATAP